MSCVYLELMTFIMKSAAVLCLVLNLRLCLAIPLSTENVPESKKSLQDDSVPIALLLFVPSASPQFRDDEQTIPDGEDISLIEDQIVNLLLRDAEISFQEDRTSEVLKEEPFLYAEDLRALNPLLRNGKDIEVRILVEKPLLLNEDAVNILPELREDKVFQENIQQERPIPSTEESASNLFIRKDIEVRLVPEESLPSTQYNAQNQDQERKQTIEDLPSDRSYEKVEIISTPNPEQIVATYPEVPENALPILLNCAPNVERGHLTDASPSYRSHDRKAKDILAKTENKTSDAIDLKNDIIDAKNSNVLDLNSPASTITMERRKRQT